MIRVDGSMLEGGGQILRNSVSFSALLGKSFHIEKIRKGRDKPGLKNQHIGSIQAVAEICSAQTTGVELNSEEITFTPGPLKSGTFNAHLSSAGACMLIAQAVLPVAILGPSCQFSLRGGTNVDFSPQYEYTKYLFIPVIKRLLDIDVEMECEGRGYFPIGGGRITLKATPKHSLKAFTLRDQGHVTNITCYIHAGGQINGDEIRKLKEKTTELLKSRFESPIDFIVHLESKSKSRTAGLIIIAETSTKVMISGDSLLTKANDFNKLATKAFNILITNLNQNGCADEYLQDQLIIFMALANGKSVLQVGEISLHTKTSIAIAELFTDGKAKFKVVEDKINKFNLIECDGMGFVNSNFV